MQEITIPLLPILRLLLLPIRLPQPFAISLSPPLTVFVLV